MDRVYLDDDGHLWYAVLTENGKSSNQRVFSSNAEEMKFFKYFAIAKSGASPTEYSIDYLQKFYNEYKRKYK